MKLGEITRMRLLSLVLLAGVGLLLVSFACGESEGRDGDGQPGLPTPMVLIDTPTPLPTNSMSLARGSHTATRLQDGRVLIAGGDDGAGRLDAITDTTELFDPTAGRWEPAPVMGRQRTQHAALLLNDGRALLVGGIGVVQAKIDEQRIDQPLIETDVFNPTTDSWSFVGEISTPRDGLTATLLASGSVLIIGGNDSSGSDDPVLDSAEVFDPATGQWSSAGNMSQSRQGHSATLLDDGTVLVAGGDAGESPFQSSEIYDPSSGAWNATGDMSDARERPTATLLEDGRVLVAGGGGESGRLTSAEIYDPQSGSWSTTGDMAAARLKHAAVRLQDGRVLVVGGFGFIGPLDSTEIYDPATNSWSLGNP